MSWSGQKSATDVFNWVANGEGSKMHTYEYINWYHWAWFHLFKVKMNVFYQVTQCNEIKRFQFYQQRIDNYCQNDSWLMTINSNYGY